MITVLICVKNSRLEDMVRQNLEADSTFRIIGARYSITSALPIVLNLEPDLFLLEESADSQVISALHYLREHNFHTSTIILNAEFTPSKMLQYIRAGAYDLIPAQVMTETLPLRLHAFSDYFSARYSETDLYPYHNRYYDNALFSMLLSDSNLGMPGLNMVDSSIKSVGLQLDGWFRCVYVSLTSDTALWPYFHISELKIIETFLRTRLKERFRSIAVITGNVRLILILNQSDPFADVTDLCREIQYFCSGEVRIDFHVVQSFGIGICGEGVQGLLKSMQTARYASLVRLNEGPGHIISYDRYFGDRQNPADFLTPAEMKKLSDSVDSKEAAQCIRVITDIFSEASAVEFVMKATAIVMALSGKFELVIVNDSKFSAEEVNVLQSIPPFLHLLKDSRQAERELKSWVVNCFRVIQQGGQNPISDKMAAAKRFVAENYLRDLDLQMIADYVGLSVPYFCSEFHKACGESFVKYLNRMRLERAAELLLVSDKKVAEIAALVGFQDARHFSSLFRKKYDTTPSDYRKKYVKKETGRV